MVHRLPRARWFTPALIVLGVLLLTRVRAELRAVDVPVFRLRARVLSAGGRAPVGRKFGFHFSLPGAAGASVGSTWSDWLTFAIPQADAALHGYPNSYLHGYPVVLSLLVDGVTDPTILQAEVRFPETGQSALLEGDLFGPRLGLVVWRDKDHRPRAATMAGYNERYWAALNGRSIPESKRAHRFPLVDRFFGGDDDRRDWGQGIQQLAGAGLTAVMLPSSAPLRDLLLKAGLRRTAWAVYNPPGYAFDFDKAVTPAAIDAWARQQAAPYLKAGYSPRDMALFAMSDEPGWYFPSMFRTLSANPAALARFREYLRDQGLAPADLGAKGWTDVRPIGSSAAGGLPSRRLFYWTMRFFSWDSARHFARCTRALEAAFYPNLPVAVNWNFFSGRLYVPGPVANNPDKSSPDAAMGGHDWLEFGRLRGCTALWTEDWFPDRMASQWSFYCAKLRSAAQKSGVQFGGYVVPRAGGDLPQGIVQKALCIVGSGGKAIEYYTFGPEYNFPGNCYSERPELLRQIAAANRMIGRAEDLLWPGEPPRAQAALLAPRSAELWDARHLAHPAGIQDATNNNLNGETVDYMAEVADLYLGLQHQDIPADFVDEDDLSAKGLGRYRVLYVTEPDIPVEGQRGIADWVRAGGTLVTVTAAGARDRYDDPCSLLSDLEGVAEKPRERLRVPSLSALGVAGKGVGSCGPFTAVGARGTIASVRGQVEARFDDGSPAVVERAVGRGRAVHFAWLPGLSYAASARTSKAGTAPSYSGSLRRWISYPARLAGSKPPVTVDQPLVETPLLLSARGAAVTMLNWTGRALTRVRLTVRVPWTVRSVGSVRLGQIAFQRSAGGVTCSVPLGAADILLLRPQRRN